MKPFQKSILIAFEGIDGSGKSTVLRAVQELLQLAGYDVSVTKEPGGTTLGRKVRALVQDPGQQLAPCAEFLLFAADRAQHVATVIRQAQAAGTIILCDRMADSSVAYQAYGRGVDRHMIDTVNQFALQGVRPDVTCYFELEYSEAQQRIAARSGEKSGYDQLAVDFFERVRKGYEELYKGRSDVWRIDARRPVSVSAQEIFSNIITLIGSDER